VKIPPHEKPYKIRVTAAYSVVSINDEFRNKPIIYNIVLERLLYGAPYDVINIGCIIIVGFIVIWRVVIPRVIPLTYLFVDYNSLH